MPYRFKSTEPFVEFKLRDRGVSGHEALTIEVEFTLFRDGTEYEPGVGFKTALKNLPRGAWHYDGDGHWFILPTYLDDMKSVACDLFKHVYQTEGTTTTDVITGSSQGGLF